jgi:hypothetical protein
VELWTVVTALGLEIVTQTASFPSSAGWRRQRWMFIHQILNGIRARSPTERLLYRRFFPYPPLKELMVTEGGWKTAPSPKKKLKMPMYPDLFLSRTS